ncbi:MAG: hypothetical protein AB7N80_12995 [Bdellovibrionales bacterium]
MFRWIPIFACGLSLIACANRPVAPQAELSPEELFQQMPQPVAAELDDDSFHQPLDEEHISAADRMRLLNEISILDAEIVAKEGQIAHFRLLDDNLWKNQATALKAEIAHLRARKTNMEAQLQR